MIARRYAKALLYLALRENLSDTVKKDIIQIGHLARQKKYFEFFTNRLIDAGDKIEALAGFNQLTRDFLKLIIANKREEYLYLISREYVGLLNKIQNVVEVEVASRMLLSSEQKNELINKLGKCLCKRVVATFKTDKRIIGGVCVKYEGKVIDGTVSGQLSNLLGQLTGD